VRYAFVARQRTHYPLRNLCRVLTVSVSGFHAYLHRRNRPDPDAGLRAELRTVHAHSRGTYGRTRMVQALRARAHVVGHKRVARLMREEGLRGKTKGRRFTPRTTDSPHCSGTDEAHAIFREQRANAGTYHDTLWQNDAELRTYHDCIFDCILVRRRCGWLACLP